MKVKRLRDNVKYRYISHFLNSSSTLLTASKINSLNMKEKSGKELETQSEKFPMAFTFWNVKREKLVFHSLRKIH